MLKTLIAASTGLLVALPVVPALASGGDPEVRTAGQCTGSARWELKVKQDDGGVEVEFEVDSNVVGQQWDYTLRGPGGVISSGTRTTTGPSGSFSVEVKTAGGINDAFRGTASLGSQSCDTTDATPVVDDRGRDDDGTDDRGRDDDGTDDRGKRDDDVITGDCTDDSVARLRVKGRKATLLVDSAQRGERWRYEIRRDGKVVREGTARTKGSKARFKVKARSGGGGSFTASAERVGADDSCRVDS
jgi:hypothetical protein